MLKSQGSKLTSYDVNKDYYWKTESYMLSFFSYTMGKMPSYFSNFELPGNQQEFW